MSDRSVSKRFQGASGMAIVAIALAVVFAASTLPSPLYPLCRQEFGFSNLVLTLIFGVYSAGNLIALGLFGRLSDQVGITVT